MSREITFLTYPGRDRARDPRCVGSVAIPARTLPSGGLLDVVIIKEMTTPKLTRALPPLFSRAHVNGLEYLAVYA